MLPFPSSTSSSSVKKQQPPTSSIVSAQHHGGHHSGSRQHNFVVVATMDCIKADKTKINFCKYPIFASSSKQITLNLDLMDYFIDYQRKDFHMLKVSAKTNPFGEPNKPSNDKTPKKVFTIKAVENGQETTELQIPVKSGQATQLFIKANIPELEISTDISGELSLQIDQFTPMCIPINSRGQVPQIVCMKQMENLSTKKKIIKIPSKNIMKIPFKNCSNINFFFEIKLVGKEGENHDTSDGVKLNVIPNQPIKTNNSNSSSSSTSGPSSTNGNEQDKNNNPAKKDQLILKVDANSTFCITLEFELLKKGGLIRAARRILILQVQGTKLMFPFPMQVIISE